MSNLKNQLVLFSYCFLSLFGLLGMYFIAYADFEDEVTKTIYQSVDWTLLGILWGGAHSLITIKWLVKKDLYILENRWWLFWVLLIHISSWAIPSILEDDYYRYSWDGRNIRLGIHPYLYAPEEIIDDKSPDYGLKINFPEYRTIYPPLVEFLFLSEVLVPDTIYGWWLLLLLADLLFVSVLWRYCKKSQSPIYFVLFLSVCLNPILLKEGLNSKHFDIMAGFVLFFWVFYVFTKKSDSLVCVILYSLSVAIRPWYLALVLWRLRFWGYLHYCLFISIFVIPWIVMLKWPGIPPVKEALSSWIAFMNQWEFNALVYDFIRRILQNWFSSYEESAYMARKVCWVLGLGGIGIAWVFSRKKEIPLWWGFVGLGFWMVCQATANVWYFLPLILGMQGFMFLDNSYRRYSLATVSALSTFLPMAYLHYADIHLYYLDFTWPLAELLLMLFWFIFIFRETKEI